MRVKFNDTGQVVEVEDVRDLVYHMRSNAAVKSNSNSDYMLGYARRAVMYNNEDIRATSEVDFVSDLLRYKHIQIL